MRRRTDGPRLIGEKLPDVIRAIPSDDPRFGLIAQALEDGRDPMAALAELGAEDEDEDPGVAA